jgi:4-hydroxybenzoate polyprenyltransferase
MSVIDPRWTEQARSPRGSAAPSSADAVPLAGTATLDPGTTFVDSTSSPASSPRSLFARIWPYVQIARVDHWFKNAFMLLGVLLAFFYEPALFAWSSAPMLLLALISTCLIASSNYVLNEILDGPRDRLHPDKRHRPVPSGRISLPLGYAEWLLVGIAGFALAWAVNRPFAYSALTLWLLGVSYNVPPVRTKEWPYLDVLSESANNAVRLLLGWFPLIQDRVPPVSLVLSYWMVGAFFMATKRFAEYRHIGDRKVAAAYRGSFSFYTDERLLVSMVFYATACALFAGIFIVRYHLELILFAPIAAGMFAYYLHIGLLPNSPVQNPEKLYRQRGFFAYMVCAAVLFVVLMFTSIPAMYDLFNVEPTLTRPLWTLGGGAN